MTRGAGSGGTGSARRRLRHVADRAVLSAVNGVAYLVDGAARPVMGTAAREIVLKDGKLEVSRISPLGDETFDLGHETMALDTERHRTPVLLVPPLMVRPYVYDLRPEHSMVRTLRNAGFDVFVVDFGVPDRRDEDVRLDRYVLDWIPAAIARTLEITGQRGLSFVGYCMGGIFGLLHAGTFRDGAVKNLVTIGAPVDFDKMGVMSLAVRLGARGLDAVLDRMGNVPGVASSLGFKVMSGRRVVTKWLDLAQNLWDEDYVRAFDAVNTWVNDLIPYPREAFKQMIHEVVHGNKLLRGGLSFGGRPCELGAVTCPLLAFAGETDNVAAPAATAAIIDLVGSRDKTLVAVPGGHVGVVGGSSAPERVWAPMMDWLAAHDASVTGA